MNLALTRVRERNIDARAGAKRPAAGRRPHVVGDGDVEGIVRPARAQGMDALARGSGPDSFAFAVDAVS